MCCDWEKTRVARARALPTHWASYHPFAPQQMRDWALPFASQNPRRRSTIRRNVAGRSNGERCAFERQACKRTDTMHRAWTHETHFGAMAVVVVVAVVAVVIVVVLQVVILGTDESKLWSDALTAHPNRWWFQPTQAHKNLFHATIPPLPMQHSNS